VKDYVLAGDCSIEGGAIPDITACLPRTQPSELGPFGGRADQYGHVVAWATEGLNQVTTHEPGRARHQRVHSERS
jgi:hypothetical protein